MKNKNGIIIGIIIILLIVWKATQSPGGNSSTNIKADQRKRIAAKVKALWGKLIKYYAALYMLPEKRVAAIVAQESGGELNARGAAGEIGLMQLMPIAIKDVDQNLKLDKTILDIQQLQGQGIFDFLFGDIFSDSKINYFDAKVNLQYGSAFLSLLNDRFGSIDEATKRYNGTGAAADAYLQSVKEYETYF